MRLDRLLVLPAALFRPGRLLVFPAALFASFVLCGCGPSKEKLEAERVLRAIDVLRDAPPEPLAAREALVAELEKQQASYPLAVEARDKCARAYRLLIEGKALQAKVGTWLNKPGGETAEVLRDFLAAEAKVKESTEAMPLCHEAAANLRRPQAANK